MPSRDRLLWRPSRSRDFSLNQQQSSLAAFQRRGDDVRLMHAHKFRVARIVSGRATDATVRVTNWRLQVPTRESQIRPLLDRLESDDDRIAVWRDVLATTNGAKISPLTT